MSIRVVLVDDTSLFRDGLRLIINLEADMAVVGTAGDGAQGVELIRRERPDVVLMDVQMPVMGGVEATRQIKAALPEIHVVMLTTYSEDELMLEALKAGAVGYLLKDMAASDLVQAVRTVSQGGALIPQAIAARLVADYARMAAGLPAPDVTPAQPLPRVADLTPREHETLKLLARGLSNREIAETLFLTEGTVKNYLSAIFAKLHARDRAQAIAMALRQGLVN